MQHALDCHLQPACYCKFAFGQSLPSTAPLLLLGQQCCKPTQASRPLSGFSRSSLVCYTARPKKAGPASVRRAAHARLALVRAAAAAAAPGARSSV